jgi:putative transposase
MKSRTNRSKRGLRAVPVGKHAAMEQRLLPIAGVLLEVRQAFQGLCVQAGLQVITALMEEDRTALCGPKGVPDAQRLAVRGGKTPTSIVLGGQRMAVHRPRVRRLKGGEIELPTFAWASDTDALDSAALAAVAAGVSTRRYATLQPELPEAVSPKHLATSKSAVSRRFVQMSSEQLRNWLAAPMAGLDLPVVMIDGIYLADSVILVALGIDAAGEKHVLGIREGSTESTRVVKALLSDLIERGLVADRARLWVIDGGKALRRGITELFGPMALVQRCQEHKRRNVLEHLPEALQAGVGKAMRDAWNGANEKLATKQLQRLATSLEADHPGAAASLREGLAETLTWLQFPAGSWAKRQSRGKVRAGAGDDIGHRAMCSIWASVRSWAGSDQVPTVPCPTLRTSGCAHLHPPSATTWVSLAGSSPPSPWPCRSRSTRRSGGSPNATAAW